MGVTIARGYITLPRDRATKAPKLDNDASVVKRTELHILPRASPSRYHCGTSHDKGSNKGYNGHEYYSVWFCDNCGTPGGSGGMSVKLNEICPECQHQRCPYCAVERRLEASTAVQNMPKRGPLSSIPPPNNLAPVLSLLGVKQQDCLKIRSTPRMMESHLDNYAAADCVDSVILNHQTDPTVKSDSLLISQPVTPSSVSNQSTTSTWDLRRSSERFSYQEENTGSETELDSDDVESEEDSTDDEVGTEYSDYALSDLEFRLLCVFGDDPDLATRVIHQIHAYLQLGLAVEGATYIAAPSHEPPGSVGGHEPVITPSSKQADGNFDNSIHPKRGRKRDESEDRRGNGTPRKRRIKSDKNPSQGRRFACHFYKKDPIRYSSHRDERFRICPRLPPSIRDLRRIKVHFLAAHRRPQCERCYAFFNDRDGLQSHHQEASCTRNDSILKEGADDSQWEKIENVLKGKRGMSPSEKQDYDRENWFEIWKILFPNLPPPDDPWDDSVQVDSTAPPYDRETLRCTFNTIIDREIERGNLPVDVRLQCQSILREALQAQDVIFGQAQALESPLHDAMQGSVEHDSVVPVAIDNAVTRKPFGEIGGDEPQTARKPSEVSQERQAGMQDIPFARTAQHMAMDLAYTANSQPFPTIPSSPADPDLNLPLPHIHEHSNELEFNESQETQEFWDCFNKMDPSDFPLFDASQDGVMPFERNDSDVDVYQLNWSMSTWAGDILMDNLVSDNERFDATEDLKTKHDGNKKLPKPCDTTDICP